MCHAFGHHAVMNMIRALILTLPLVLLGFSNAATADDGVRPHAVVELYTSEGCSSCPPADAALYTVKQDRHDLLVLSYHVDYWNYLGWTDPFSSAMFTDRQHAYAQHMRERYVYTPQIIINGHHVVKSPDQQTIKVASNQTAPLQDIVDLTLAPRDKNHPARGSIKLRTLSPQNNANGLKLWLVGFDDERARNVRSGENAGRRLVHANVVREMIDLGTWNGTADQRSFTMTSPCDGGVAVLVQDGSGGPIIAASMVQF